ncbi:MAG: hypothetical protein NZM31_10380 [Gemmatales bacterium]|nr:hypothetical protein [Gemmatales bacterium]MDW8387403.1 hypothetical protein [Gemmatales bacterium]
MEDLTIPEGGNADRLAKTVMARYDGPAYMRRARQMELAIEALHRQCQTTRDEMLHLVRHRLGLLLEMAGSWQALVPHYIDTPQAEVLRQLGPEPHWDAAPSGKPKVSPSRLRSALHELCEAIAWFNLRWLEFLQGLDLDTVNGLIAGYNRWYVLEKECAVGSIRVARQGFRPVPPITREDLKNRYPPLPLPGGEPSDRVIRRSEELL